MNSELTRIIFYFDSSHAQKIIQNLYLKHIQIINLERIIYLNWY